MSSGLTEIKGLCSRRRYSTSPLRTVTLFSLLAAVFVGSWGCKQRKGTGTVHSKWNSKVPATWERVCCRPIAKVEDKTCCTGFLCSLHHSLNDRQVRAGSREDLSLLNYRILRLFTKVLNVLNSRLSNPSLESLDLVNHLECSSRRGLMNGGKCGLFSVANKWFARLMQSPLRKLRASTFAFQSLISSCGDRNFINSQKSIL